MTSELNQQTPSEGRAGERARPSNWAYDWPIQATSLQVSFYDVIYDDA